VEVRDSSTEECHGADRGELEAVDAASTSTDLVVMIATITTTGESCCKYIGRFEIKDIILDSSIILASMSQHTNMYVFYLVISVNQAPHVHTCLADR